MLRPTVSPAAFVARDAVLCGDVTLEARSSVWFHTTIRAEEARIVVGEGSNIQDNCVIHVDRGYDALIGQGVTVGHGAILHGCQIGDNTLIGMGSIVLNGAVIGRNCIVGAGSLITQNMVVPDNSMVFGSPARVRRTLTEQEIATNAHSARDYITEAAQYAENGFFTQGLPE
jgi:carbonic anhydrase/acetyltransferase-like protein (isoleucine patch superfamily)